MDPWSLIASLFGWIVLLVVVALAVGVVVIVGWATVVVGWATVVGLVRGLKNNSESRTQYMKETDR